MEQMFASQIIIIWVSNSNQSVRLHLKGCVSLVSIFPLILTEDLKITLFIYKSSQQVNFIKCNTLSIPITFVIHVIKCSNTSSDGEKTNDKKIKFCSVSKA